MHTHTVYLSKQHFSICQGLQATPVLSTSATTGTCMRRQEAVEGECTPPSQQHNTSALLLAAAATSWTVSCFLSAPSSKTSKTSSAGQHKGQQCSLLARASLLQSNVSWAAQQQAFIRGCLPGHGLLCFTDSPASCFACFLVPPVPLPYQMLSSEMDAEYGCSPFPTQELNALKFSQWMCLHTLRRRVSAVRTYDTKNAPVYLSHV